MILPKLLNELDDGRESDEHDDVEEQEDAPILYLHQSFRRIYRSEIYGNDTYIVKFTRSKFEFDSQIEGRAKRTIKKNKK